VNPLRLGGLLLRSSGQAFWRVSALAMLKTKEIYFGGRSGRPALDGCLVHLQRQALTGTRSVSEMPTIRPGRGVSASGAFNFREPDFKGGMNRAADASANPKHCGVYRE